MEFRAGFPICTRGPSASNWEPLC